MEEFWPIPEDEWTVVERSHRKPRGNSSSYQGRTHNPSGKLDNIGMRYDDLDDIIDTKGAVKLSKGGCTDRRYVPENHNRHRDSL